jgi:hypothetical protein
MAYGNALGEAGLEREAVACFLALQEMDRTDPLGARFETLKYVRDPETGEPLPPLRAGSAGLHMGRRLESLLEIAPFNLPIAARRPLPGFPPQRKRNGINGPLDS